MPASGQSPLEVKGVPRDVPVTFTATATAVELAVDLQIEPEWHMYGRDVGGGRPVSVELDPNGAFQAAGALSIPMNSKAEVTGRARLVLPLKRVGEGDVVRATMRFQVCDALMCLEPMELEIHGEIEPLKVLLVVDADNERSRRIAGWIADRGFALTVATYDEVSLDQCDGSDVVIADSHYFGETKARNQARAFPKTTTPIVAVGFLGTELIEAHGIAMTSGYI